MIKVCLIYVTKQNYVTQTKLKKYDENKVKLISLLILKKSFLTLIGCWVKKHQILTLYMVRWIGLVLMTAKTYENGLSKDLVKSWA